MQKNQVAWLLIKRMVEIYYDPELPVIDVLTKIDLAPGVFYRICLS
jgi:hypothetical protein